MIQYMKNISREVAVIILIVIAISSCIIGVYCGSLLNQKDRAKANEDRVKANGSIANAQDVLRKATAERNELKRKYAQLTDKQKANTLPTHLPRQYTQERYYRDSHGEIVAESEAEAMLQRVRNNVHSMPDGLERAYYEGMLQSVETEYKRMKRQGPISR